MADDIEKIEVKDAETVKPKSSKKGGKYFILKQPLRLGSNKDGSPKKVYAVGDKIRLSAKKAELYKSLKLI